MVLGVKMSNSGLEKTEYAGISRLICLLLNRAMMYQPDHPHIQDAINTLHQQLADVSSRFSNLVLILTQDQLFIDEEPVDPRINASRIIALLKKIGVQSISFVNGISPEEILAFIQVFTASDKYPDSDKIIQELNFRGLEKLKINHVFYKKITKDDEVISRQEKGEIVSQGSGGGDPGISGQFMKMMEWEQDALDVSLFGDAQEQPEEPQRKE